MTESTTGPLSDVAELDEERRRYERWIAELGARRASTPDHVFRRVLDDYERRLDEVIGKLAEHGEALRATVEELNERVQNLRAERQAREDERVEAQLRHEVGEYGDEKWKEIRARSEKEIDVLTKQLEDSEAELGRLQQVLSLTAPPAAAPEPPAAPFQPRQQPPPAPAPAAAPPPRAATPPSVPAAPPSPLIEPRPDAAAAFAASDPDSGGWPGDASFRGSAGRRDTPPNASTNPLGLGDAGGAQIKTLRCQECGTMNYPTEWYCERCGGELAAL